MIPTSMSTPEVGLDDHGKWKRLPEKTAKIVAKKTAFGIYGRL
jgi:hypothetical protein